MGKLANLNLGSSDDRREFRDALVSVLFGSQLEGAKLAQRQRQMEEDDFMRTRRGLLFLVRNGDDTRKKLAKKLLLKSIQADPVNKKGRVLDMVIESDGSVKLTLNLNNIRQEDREQAQQDREDATSALVETAADIARADPNVKLYITGGNEKTRYSLAVKLVKAGVTNLENIFVGDKSLSSLIASPSTPSTRKLAQEVENALAGQPDISTGDAAATAPADAAASATGAAGATAATAPADAAVASAAGAATATAATAPATAATPGGGGGGGDGGGGGGDAQGAYGEVGAGVLEDAMGDGADIPPTVPATGGVDASTPPTVPATGGGGGGEGAGAPPPAYDAASAAHPTSGGGQQQELHRFMQEGQEGAERARNAKLNGTVLDDTRFPEGMNM